MIFSKSRYDGDKADPWERSAPPASGNPEARFMSPSINGMWHGHGLGLRLSPVIGKLRVKSHGNIVNRTHVPAGIIKAIGIGDCEFLNSI
jgi:hypothetical protein